MNPLSPDDFPLVCVGPHIYRRTLSSPVLTAPTASVAADICNRLNRDHFGEGLREPEKTLSVTISHPPITVFSSP